MLLPCSGAAPYIGWPHVETNLPETAPLFSVLIVNFNGDHYVQGALDSLARQTRSDFEVILVDNASEDGSADGLETSGLPAFTLLKETVNHGFAGGNNLAARHAKGKWLALLNPDAAAAPDWLDKVAEGTARHPDVTSFACTQIAMHSPELLDGAGDNYLGFGIPWRGGYRRPISDLPGEGTCFSPCGASAIHDRELFLREGGFDERLFCFCEDVDLGFRLRMLGETCVFLPEAVVHHAGGGLSDKVSGFAVRIGTRNRLWVYVKNMPALGLWLTLPGHIALVGTILLRGMMTGRSANAFQGLREGLVGLGPVLAARKDVQARRTVSLGKLLGAMSWNPVRMLGRHTHVRAGRQDGTRPS